MTTLKPATINIQALAILRALTPSEAGHHPSPNYPHEHPLSGVGEPYERTGDLADRWNVRRQGAVKAVSIINDMYYAIYVEYGWYTTKGTYVPGHFMLKQALPKLRALFVKENRKRLHIFLRQRPISKGVPVKVDYSEYQYGEVEGELFDAFGSLGEHETGSK